MGDFVALTASVPEQECATSTLVPVDHSSMESNVSKGFLDLTNDGGRNFCERLRQRSDLANTGQEYIDLASNRHDYVDLAAIGSQSDNGKLW